MNMSKNVKCFAWSVLALAVVILLYGLVDSRGYKTGFNDGIQYYENR